MLLQNLDLVSVRVLDKEKPRHEFVVAVEFLNVIGLKAQLGHSSVLSMTIINADGNVTISVAMGVRLSLSLIEGQLDFKIILIITQVNLREIVEVELIGNFQTKSLVVKANGFI